NIAAYTVKNVEVYRGQTDKEKWENDSTKEKHLTMDVKLKREYMIGWIVNAQGGIGTKDRYTGRLFANWFSPTSSVTLLGNINNLNDNRKPGKSDTWTPERMPSGTRIYKMGALNYRHETKDERLTVNGHVTFEQTTRNNSTTTARTNFLSSGDTYENRFARSYNRNAQLETRHTINMHNDAIWGYAMALGRCKTADRHGDALSGTFNTEQKDMTLKALEALYTASTQETLDAVINRANTRSLGKSREYEVQFYPGFDWKLPKSSDRIHYEFGLKYNSKKENDWDDYTINYGADPNPAVRTRRYRDNQPNHVLTLINNLAYRFNINRVFLGVNYEYRFADRWRDSHSFALDRLADMGIFGVLPEGYASALDPDNSYTSHQMQNQHSLQLTGSWYEIFKDKSYLHMYVGPEVTFLHDHMDYRRAGRLYPLKHDFVTLNIRNYRALISYEWKPIGEGRRQRYVNELMFMAKSTPKNPGLLDMVDVINDSDPLNISQGNPDLRPQQDWNFELKWFFKPDRPAHPLNNTISVSYNFVDDAIVRGYTYDTATGVRHNRSYNL
ncbi:MAG: outer membrane beta-barrel protein, partial [Duncaniella sp.]|nr:outer membrane beta-barrel protein [Duncaniella sp.]